MLRSRLGELWRVWIQGRQLVGVDAAGNKFYKWEQRDGERIFEKREVQLFKRPWNMADYDVDCIAPEWSSWLSMHRKDAPTAEDMQRLREYRKRAAANARIADAEDAKNRVRRATMGQEVGPDMDAFLRQLGHGGAPKATAAHRSAMDGTESRAADEFQPEQWMPGKK